MLLAAKPAALQLCVHASSHIVERVSCKRLMADGETAQMLVKVI